MENQKIQIYKNVRFLKPARLVWQEKLQSAQISKKVEEQKEKIELSPENKKKIREYVKKMYSKLRITYINYIMSEWETQKGKGTKRERHEGGYDSSALLTNVLKNWLRENPEQRKQIDDLVEKDIEKFFEKSQEIFSLLAELLKAGGKELEITDQMLEAIDINIKKTDFVKSFLKSALKKENIEKLQIDTLNSKTIPIFLKIIADDPDEYFVELFVRFKGNVEKTNNAFIEENKFRLEK